MTIGPGPPGTGLVPCRCMGEQKDRLERLGEFMVLLLNAAEPMSRFQIETAIGEYRDEKGRRRFEEDKKTLRQAGIPLRGDAPEGEKGEWFYEIRKDEYYLPELDLTGDEVVALNIACRSVDFTDVLWGRLAGAKIGALGADHVSTVARLPGVELVPRLHDAVHSRIRLRTTYNGTSREIDPYGIAMKHGNWYLVGFDSHRSDVIPFRIDRMDADDIDDVSSGAFDVPSGFDAEASVPDDAITMGRGEPVEATVRVDSRIAELTDFDVGDAVAEEGDEVVLTVPVTHEGAFVAWVLGLGELAVVEGPPELRDAVVARLQELAGR